MKKFLFSVLAVAFSASQALAVDPAPLAPGKPAGVHQAQLRDGTLMVAIAGATLVGIGIALATASDSASGPPPTNSTSSTTP